MTIRVMVVDDSAFIRKAVTRMLSSDPEVQVVAQLADGAEAIERLHELAPDVITLDLRMPGLDGMSTLREVMRVRPTPVVLLSAYAQRDGALTLEALASGAVDFIDKSGVGAMDVYHLAEELAGKVKAAARCRVERDGAPVRPEPAPVRAGGERPQPRATAAGAGIVVIGASTGGPPAIARLLGWLPRDFAAPVLIVQHMPSGYTAAFAERLGRAGRLPVRHAEDGDPVLPGQALVAPGGMNLGLRLAGGAVVAHVMDGPAHSMLRPSLDICLEAAVGTFGGATCAVVLTGMGNDGVLGAAAVRAAGGRVFAQSAESCVVFGMPKAVIHAGLATEVASLEEIGEMLAGWRRRT